MWGIGGPWSEPDAKEESQGWSSFVGWTVAKPGVTTTFTYSSQWRLSRESGKTGFAHAQSSK